MAGKIIRKKVIWRIENFTRNAIEDQSTRHVDYYSDDFEIFVNGKKSNWHVGVEFEDDNIYDLFADKCQDKNENGSILCRAKINSSLLVFNNKKKEVNNYTEYLIRNDFHDEDDTTKVYDYDHDLFNYPNVKKIYGWSCSDEGWVAAARFEDDEELLLDERNNGNITFIFDIEVEDMEEDFQKKINADNSFIKSIARFFNSDIFSDLTIVCSDGLEIPAHRMIIASRCEALKSAVLDNKTGKLIIEDIESNVMLEILRYIYGGTVKNQDKLTVAAEKYNLSDLRSLCVSELIQQISSDTRL